MIRSQISCCIAYFSNTKNWDKRHQCCEFVYACWYRVSYLSQSSLDTSEHCRLYHDYLSARVVQISRAIGHGNTFEAAPSANKSCLPSIIFFIFVFVFLIIRKEKSVASLWRLFIRHSFSQSSTARPYFQPSLKCSTTLIIIIIIIIIINISSF